MKRPKADQHDSWERKGGRDMGYLLDVGRADKDTIEALIGIGALFVDEEGVHCSAPGVYRIEDGIDERGV